MSGFWRKPAGVGMGWGEGEVRVQPGQRGPRRTVPGEGGGSGLGKSGCLSVTLPLRTTRTEQQSAPFVWLSSRQASTQCTPRKSQEGLRVSTLNHNISEAQGRWSLISSQDIFMNVEAIGCRPPVPAEKLQVWRSGTVHRLSRIGT